MADPMVVDGPVADPMAVDDQQSAAGAGDSVRNQELLAKIAALEESNACHVKSNATNAESISALIKKGGDDELKAAKTIAALTSDNEALTAWRKEAEAAGGALTNQLGAAGVTIATLTTTLTAKLNEAAATIGRLNTVANSLAQSNTGKKRYHRRPPR